MVELTKKEILHSRFSRKLRQLEILKEYSGYLISVTMNIPGNIKSTPKIIKAFEICFKRIEEKLLEENYIIDGLYQYSLGTGPEGYICVKGESFELKNLLISMETEWKIGRLLDLDLIEQELRLISRADIDIPARSCFICGEEANVCRRNNTHSYDELSQYVEQLLNELLASTDQ